MIFICLGIYAPAAAGENERYKALPLGPGGPVFIIDTQEGYLWTWTNTGLEETSVSGLNPRIRYQGNVKKNMAPPQASSPTKFPQHHDDTRF